MKWLADENISNSAVDLLRQRGQEVLTVASLAPAARDSTRRGSPVRLAFIRPRPR